MPFILLAGGLVLLVWAGDALVNGAVAAARRMHIPPLIVGLTIVAMGTSAPELVVSMQAALDGASGLAIGNALGSNITNILLVMGVPAMLRPTLFEGSGIRRATTFMAAITLLLIGLSLDGTIGWGDGLILVTLLLVYLAYSGMEATRTRASTKQAAQLAGGDPHMPIWRILVLLMFGVLGLGLGGRLTTDGALGVAALFGLADSAIGLTVVALGTSLPELAASIAAGSRGHAGVAIGNVIGSNIFNILGILGFTALVTPLAVAPSFLRLDYWIMLGVALLLLPLAYKTRRVGRVLGALMTLGYLVFVGQAILNGAASPA